MEPPRCRCCLSNETLTDMKANYFTTRGDQNTVSYLEAYLTLLAIPDESKLLEVSGMNTELMNICIECSSHLESAYIFRQLCTDVNDMLKTQNERMAKQNKMLAKKASAVPVAGETTFTETMQIISQLKVENEFVEQPDGDGYQEATDRPVDSVACGQCDSRFKTLAGLNKHIQRAHQNDSYPQQTVEDTTSFSDMMSRLSGGLKKETAHCHACARTFLTDSGLARHIARKHTVNASAYRAFAANISGNSGGKFACPSCEKTFHHMSTLNLHREKHSTEKFQCPLCAAKYKHSFNLKTHMSKIHKIVKAQ
jgi:Zinc finger, C2H2 type